MLLRRAFFGDILPEIAHFGAGATNFGSYALGNTGTKTALTAPLAPWNTPTRWSQIALTYENAAFIRSDGTLWTAGSNTYGELGQGDTTLRATLTQVGTATHWVKVGTGTSLMGALDRNGNIWVAGRNTWGQGNKATLEDNLTTLYNTALTGPPYRMAPIRFVDMWVGHRFILGLDDVGNIWSWGNNGSRQLGRDSPEENSPGQNSTQDRYCKLIDVPGPFRFAAAGAYGGAAFHVDGTVWIWGDINFGQLGPGAASQAPVAVAPNAAGTFWVNAFLGEYTVFLLRNDGTLWARGQNTTGQLGIGTTGGPVGSGGVSTFTQVTGNDSGRTVTEWRFVRGGYGHTMAVAQDGSLWAWGQNASRQLGREDLSATVHNTPKLIDGGSGWRFAEPGEFSTIAARVP